MLALPIVTCCLLHPTVDRSTQHRMGARHIRMMAIVGPSPDLSPVEVTECQLAALHCKTNQHTVCEYGS